MEDLIEIYNDYIEFNNFTNKELSNNLKKKYLKRCMEKYKDYPNLFDIFDKFELRNGIFTIKYYLNNFYENIENKVKKDKKHYDEILNEYNFDGYHSLAKFLLDLILADDIIDSEDLEDQEDINKIKNISYWDK
jgi:hypothetical protein